MLFFILVALIIFFSVSKHKNKETAKIIKVIMMILVGLPVGFFLVIFVLAFFFAFLFDGGNGDIVADADGFTIEEYVVNLDVQEDNVVYVTEDVTVNWNESHHHGIYKFTPEWLTYTGVDNRTIKRKSKITDMKAVDELYSLDTVKKKKRIRIGSPYEYVPLGLHTYTIKYTYDMGRDPFKGNDEFIFHAFGDYWGTEIKNATIKVNMPSEFERNNIKFFLDKKRFDEATEFVDYEINGNTLVAKFNNDKYLAYQEKEYCDDYIGNNCKLPSYLTKTLKKSLTVDILLPDKYFKGGSWNYGFISFSISMIIIILAIITVINWYKYGKDFKKRAQTVEFYPPENYNAAEIGYIYKKDTSRKLTIALIVELAAKGYIQINELDNKDKDIEIVNLYPKPIKYRMSTKKKPTRILTVRKLKDSTEDLSSSEKTMMTYLFRKGDVKILDKNLKKFDQVRDSLVNQGFIVIEDEITNDIDAASERLNEVILNSQKEYEEKIRNLPSLSQSEIDVMDALFVSDNKVILSEHGTFYKVFDRVSQKVVSDLRDKLSDKAARRKRGWTIFFAIISVIMSLISYFKIADMDPAWSYIYYLTFIADFVIVFFIFIMGRKTAYGEEIHSRVLGFKNFLERVEKEKLEELVEQNPRYFYDILPYCYVLNISKKWIKKFEDIPMPEVNMGNFDYANDWAYRHMANNVYEPAPVSSSSGGGSSCGGGCSSGGGGCSSCGGGGSW